MSWVGLATATIGLLGAFHLVLERANFRPNFEANLSTFTLVKNGFMELWRNGETMETMGNYGDPFGSDYWRQWDNLIGYITPCSNWLTPGWTTSGQEI